MKSPNYKKIKIVWNQFTVENEIPVQSRQTMWTNSPQPLGQQFAILLSGSPVSCSYSLGYSSNVGLPTLFPNQKQTGLPWELKVQGIQIWEYPGGLFWFWLVSCFLSMCHEAREEDPRPKYAAKVLLCSSSTWTIPGACTAGCEEWVTSILASVSLLFHLKACWHSALQLTPWLEE